MEDLIERRSGGRSGPDDSGISPEEPARREEDVSDEDVVRRVLGGDESAFAVLVERNVDRLYRHASRMVRDPDVAADLVQATLVRGFRKLESCRKPERVGSWLFGICANLCRDHLRDPRRDERSLERMGREFPAGGNPHRNVEKREMSVALEDALAALSPEQREAFVLKHVDGRSYPEMAELLETSVSALKMRVHRAREELQRLLEVYR